MNFAEHGTTIASRISKKINILKSIAGIEWGISTQSLLRYVNSCLHPIAEYGFPALSKSRFEPFENAAIKKIDAAMRKALRIALGVPQCTKTELVHFLSDTMPLNNRVRQAALIYHNKILHFGSQHPFYKAISKVGNFPIMKTKRTKPQNGPGKIVNKRQTWAAVMIDMR